MYELQFFTHLEYKRQSCLRCLEYKNLVFYQLVVQIYKSHMSASGVMNQVEVDPCQNLSSILLI